MGFSFGKQDLDLVLVSTVRVADHFVYHLVLLFRYSHRPHNTFMGFDKGAWVESIMKASVTSFSFILFGYTEFV